VQARKGIDAVSQPFSRVLGASPKVFRRRRDRDVAFGVVTSKLRDDAIPGAGLNGTDEYARLS
jgi:hypothetical protein